MSVSLGKGGDRVIDQTACMFIAQYFAQKRLAKLGYQFNGDDLDVYTAEALLLVDSEVNIRMMKEAETKAKGRR